MGCIVGQHRARAGGYAGYGLIVGRKWANYQALAGVPPSPRAVLAYDAANLLLDSIAQTMQMQRKWYNKFPDRAAISRAIGAVERTGISGKITFNEQGQRMNAPLWMYQISHSNYPGTLLVP